MGPIGFVFGAAKKVYEGGKNVSEFLDESEEEKELKLLKQESKLLEQEKKAAIKDLLKEIREADPSGYIKIKRRYFWYDAEKLLNKFHVKEAEELLKEENPELFNKFYKKLGLTYFWCNAEEIMEKYKEKVAEEMLKEEDPEAYKTLLFWKRVKMILIISSVILILGLLIYIFF